MFLNKDTIIKHLLLKYLLMIWPVWVALGLVDQTIELIGRFRLLRCFPASSAWATPTISHQILPDCMLGKTHFNLVQNSFASNTANHGLVCNT